MRAARKAAGMTQADLAAGAFTTANTIARIERGEMDPSLTMASAIAGALGCRIDDLLRRKSR